MLQRGSYLGLSGSGAHTVYSRQMGSPATRQRLQFRAERIANLTESVIREIDAAGGWRIAPSTWRKAIPDFRSRGSEGPMRGRPAPTTVVNPIRHHGAPSRSATKLTEGPRRPTAWDSIGARKSRSVARTEGMISTLLGWNKSRCEVSFFEPVYENLRPDSNSKSTRRIVSAAAARLDFIRSDELAGTFNSNTKAIILNTPNNPRAKCFARGMTFIGSFARSTTRWRLRTRVTTHPLRKGRAPRHIPI